VFKVLAESLPGQTYNIDSQKNAETGYWDWVSATRVLEGGTSEVAPAPAAPSAAYSRPSSPATAAPKSNYETPEERAAKQVYIVKQSSISSAIDLLTTGAKSPPTVAAVLETAQQFTDFVFGKADLFKQKNDLPAADEFEDVPL
jgi:hypothetical protein